MGLTCHHLNTVTFCGVPGPLMNGRWSLSPLDWLQRGRLACHCLLLETPAGLVLVDTGLSAHELEHGGFVSQVRRRLMSAEQALPDTARELVRSYGHAPDEVHHILLTHLDPDHAGGLADFPNAQVHVLEDEWQAAMQPPHWRQRLRYHPDNWAHGPRWVRHQPLGERWFGFEAVQAPIPGVEDILMIPLPGHSAGHCGVAVHTTDGWLLHGGDAWFSRKELDYGGSAPPAIAAIEALFEHDRDLRLANLARVRSLRATHPDIRLICSHDPEDARACQCAGRRLNG